MSILLLLLILGTMLGFFKLIDWMDHAKEKFFEEEGKLRGWWS